MKIFSAAQIREADRLTIEREPIASIDLMERAAGAVFRELEFLYPVSSAFAIFCGPGNNGGDGLALARLLKNRGNVVKVFVSKFSSEGSKDFRTNLEHWETLDEFAEIAKASDLPKLSPELIIVDALFGTGLSRPLEGVAAALVQHLNRLPNFKIAIDLPSGLMTEFNAGNSLENILHANVTLTFQWPKLAFMLADFGHAAGEFIVLNIGLWQEFEKNTASSNHFLTAELLVPLIKERKKFSHKNSYGHVAIFGGSRGKMGAAVLCSKAALRSGAGLVTAVLPFGGYPVIQSAVPEVMCIPGELEDHLYSGDFVCGFSAVAIGPGLGRHPETEQLVKLAIQSLSQPLVLDADALNALAENPTWLAFLPKMSILTPHPGEFDRLAGKRLSAEERYQEAKNMSIRFGVIVVLKGARTQVALPDGTSYFNSTGNAGMATAGSGDVLTGIIVGLLAQGYTPVESSLLGVYLHGLAGDLALEYQSVESLVAGDIIESLGDAFKETCEEF